MAQAKVVEQFGNGVPHPHEFDHETKQMAPMVRMSCTCGYDGIAILDSAGKPICPNEQALKAQFNATQDAIVENQAAPEAVHELVAAAVAKQLGPMQDLIAQLTAKLAEKAADASGKVGS